MFTTGYTTGGGVRPQHKCEMLVKIELHNHLRCFVRRMTVKMMWKRMMMMVMMMVRVMMMGRWMMMVRVMWGT